MQKANQNFKTTGRQTTTISVYNNSARQNIIQTTRIYQTSSESGKGHSSVDKNIVRNNAYFCLEQQSKAVALRYDN